MKQYHRAYLIAFVLTLLVVWSPSNALAYLAPFAAIAVFIAMTRSGLVMRNMLVLFLVWGIIISAYILLSPDFLLHSALLSVLTYSSFLVVVAIPRQFVVSRDLLDRMLTWARWLVVIEAVVGIVQGIYGFMTTGSFDLANGDFVEGTIHPALASELSLSNPMFAINMTLLLLALLPDLILRRKGYLAFALGGLSLIMASVVHVLIILATAIVLSTLLFRPISLRRRMTYLVAFGLVVTVILASFLLRRNFSTASGFARRLLSGESYRSIAIQRAVVEMPGDYPLLPLVGLGPGQFSSRAGLIGTGLYFGGPLRARPVPFLPQGMTQAFRENTLDLWVQFVEGRSGGSTHLPFLSWLSVYVEWGVGALLAILGIVVILLLRLKRVARSYPQRVMAAACSSGILVILLLGLQENYWEVPQAIFAGMLLLKVQYAVIMNWTAQGRLADHVES